MEHHKPHPSAVFEGYYSKFDLPSGSHLALIACRIQDAQQKPYMVSFTYVPSPNSSSSIFQREIWAESMEMTPSADGQGFRITIPGTGFINWDSNRTTYDIESADFSFKATSSSRTPWSKTTDTPESLLVHLPLPLHWHVQSLSSQCTFTLDIPSLQASLPEIDRKGTAQIHDEKNWAHSFPSAHIWLQARSSSSDNKDHHHREGEGGEGGICLAGGRILGMEAFLLGYRSSSDKNLSLDFRPPFALRVLNYSPFLSYTSSWPDRTFHLSVQNFTRKIVVRARAPEGTFFSLSSPFPEGHRENFLGQSFRATIEVEVFERTGWWFLGGGWRLVRVERFEEGSLEFGGGYYPPAGSEGRFH